MTGKTTRNVDRWVQELFKKGITYIYERDEKGNISRLKNTECFTIFNTRMVIEHPDVKYKILSGNFSSINCIRVTLSE